MSSVPSFASVYSVASDKATSKHIEDQVSLQRDVTQCGVEDEHSLVSAPEPENGSVT